MPTRSPGHRRAARGRRRRGLLRPARASTTSRSGRRCASRRSGWSASATSRPRRTPPTATRARRPARRRADDDRAGRGEHARRRRRGVGVALADPRDRDRHPDDAAAARASTAACCTRPAARRDMFAPVSVAGRGARRRSDATRRCGRRGRRRRRARLHGDADRPAGAEASGAPAPRGAASSRRTAPRPADAAARSSTRAERPLIWAGAGARDRADEVRALAERLAAPVLTTYGGRGVLPPGHRCCVGLPPHVAGRRARCGTRPTW